MISSIVVTVATDLFAFGIEAPGDVIIRVALFRNPVADPDESLCARTRNRRLQTELDSLIAGVVIAALRRVERQGVSAACQTEHLRSAARLLDKPDLRTVRCIGIAAGKSASICRHSSV